MKDRVGDERAHQFGTAALIGALALYFAALQRRWPLPSRREAIEVGLTWSALTVLFEFGLGRFVTHKSWAEMTADYDLTEGRVWALVPAWMAVGPEAARVLDP